MIEEKKIFFLIEIFDTQEDNVLVNNNHPKNGKNVQRYLPPLLSLMSQVDLVKDLSLRSCIISSLSKS